MPERFLPRKPRALGNRGKMLLVLGAIWVALGVGVITEGDAAVWDRTPLVLIPSWVRAAAWIGTGAYAIAVAWRPILRVRDAGAWTGLYVMPAVRAVCAGIGWIDSHVPGHTEGYERGWLTALIYIAIVAAVRICAGWPESPKAAERMARELAAVQQQRAARAARRRERA